MTTIRFLVDIDIERESGKFAGRDEISEQFTTAIEEAIENAELSGLGNDGNSVYAITSQDVDTIDNARLKKLWEDNERRVVDPILTNFERRDLNKKVKDLQSVVEDLKGKLKDKKAKDLEGQTKVHTSSYGRPEVNLPDDSQVRFHIDPKVYLDASIKDGHLQINGSEPILIRPSSGNHVAIKGAGYGS